MNLLCLTRRIRINECMTALLWCKRASTMNIPLHIRVHRPIKGVQHRTNPFAEGSRLNLEGDIFIHCPFVNILHSHLRVPTSAPYMPTCSIVAMVAFFRRKQIWEKRIFGVFFHFISFPSNKTILRQIYHTRYPHNSGPAFTRPVYTPLRTQHEIK